MMSNGGEKTYRPWHPEHYRHEAHRPETKLPQDDLVFFLLDTVPKLDLSRFYALYVRIPRESWLLLTFRDAMRTCQNQVN